MKHIVAIGGGGFSSEEDDKAIDRYLLDLTGKKEPRALFLPQASAEAPAYVEAFLDAYGELGAKPSWLSLYGRVERGSERCILEQDIIYVGGGNTRSMLALWREWGVDQLLRGALEQGTVLAGISAGAICWFEQGVSDSVWPLVVMDCLGFLKGSCCPHYDGEPERRPAYLKFVKEGQAIPGIALCDGAAAHFVDGKLHKVITSRSSAQALHLDAQGVETSL